MQLISYVNRVCLIILNILWCLLGNYLHIFNLRVVGTCIQSYLLLDVYSLLCSEIPSYDSMLALNGNPKFSSSHNHNTLITALKVPTANVISDSFYGLVLLIIHLVTN